MKTTEKTKKPPNKNGKINREDHRGYAREQDACFECKKFRKEMKNLYLCTLDVFRASNEVSLSAEQLVARVNRKVKISICIATGLSLVSIGLSVLLLLLR